MDSEDEMLKYVRYSSVFLVLFMAVCLAVSLVLIVAGSLKISGLIDLPVSWPALPVGLLLMGFAFVPSLSYRRVSHLTAKPGGFQRSMVHGLMSEHACYRFRIPLFTGACLP